MLVNAHFRLSSFSSMIRDASGIPVFLYYNRHTFRLAKNELELMNYIF